VEQFIDKRSLLCAHCGGGRLIPLTVSVHQPEHHRIVRIKRPVRLELKCIACGKRHLARPSVLLAN